VRPARDLLSLGHRRASGDLSRWDVDEIEAVAAALNSRPRKTLGGCKAVPHRRDTGSGACDADEPVPEFQRCRFGNERCGSVSVDDAAHGRHISAVSTWHSATGRTLMHVFVTGTSGYIGDAAATRLLRAGHTVTGLTRDVATAVDLARLGIQPVVGTLDDAALLTEDARRACAVVNAADWIRTNADGLACR
jgi:hypothetical protein